METRVAQQSTEKCTNNPKITTIENRRPVYELSISKPYTTTGPELERPKENLQGKLERSVAPDW